MINLIGIVELFVLIINMFMVVTFLVYLRAIPIIIEGIKESIKTRKFRSVFLTDKFKKLFIWVIIAFMSQIIFFWNDTIEFNDVKCDTIKVDYIASPSDSNSFEITEKNKIRDILEIFNGVEIERIIFGGGGTRHEKGMIFLNVYTYNENLGPYHFIIQEDRIIVYESRYFSFKYRVVDDEKELYKTLLKYLENQ